MSDDGPELNLRPLEKLLKALKGKPPIGRIGILGDTARADGGPSNSTIGAAHEFGTSTIPQRSFLREPITEHLEKELENSGALDKDVLAQVVAQGSVKPWLEKVMIVAEAVVQEGFASNGYGKWQSWSPGYSNSTGQILVDTTQLRSSITSEVKD